ncbi:MAG: CAP domain-containing protein [Patescibacteria group bacterium]
MIQQRSMMVIFFIFGIIVLFALVFLAHRYDQSLKEQTVVEETTNVQEESAENEVGSEDEVQEVGTSTDDVVKTEPSMQEDATSDSEDETEIETIAIDPCATGSFAEQFTCVLNEYRDSEGLSAVLLSQGLSEVATDHSVWMEEEESLSHIGNQGSTFSQRCEQRGLMCSAENVAFGFVSADHLLTLWQQSALHNENLLGNFSSVGVGVSGSYATLIFEY